VGNGTCLAQEPHSDSHEETQAGGGSDTLTWGAEADFNYRYVWHGIAFTRGPVFQPSAYVSKYDLTLTVWNNLNLNNESQRGQVTETDLILGYTKTWGGWTIEPTYYAYLNRPPRGQVDPETSELWVKVSHPAGPIRIYTTQSFDIQSYRGSYYGDSGVAYEHKWGKTTLDSTASAGWASSKFNEVYIGPAKNAFNFLGGDVSVTYPLRSHLSLRPHFEFSRIMDGDLRRALLTPTVWSAGLALGVDF
jgi:hypothetical protein